MFFRQNTIKSNYIAWSGLPAYSSIRLLPNSSDSLIFLDGGKNLNEGWYFICQSVYTKLLSYPLAMKKINVYTVVDDICIFKMSQPKPAVNITSTSKKSEIIPA